MSHHITDRTGGELLVAALAAHGVDTIFGIPGTHNLGIFAALPGGGIRTITTRHEQGAGYAADGYARSTGRVGVAITTTGPAALNAITALGQAYSDSVPVLLIAPGMPTGHPSHGNGLLHELRDQRAAVAGTVAEARRVESVDEIPVAVAAAFARMGRGRSRPEYLEIPLDLLDATGRAADVPALGVGAPEVPPPALVRAAAEALLAAPRIAIIAGGGAAGAAEEVQRIAERLNAAVVTSTNGKGTLREDHALALGAGMQLPALVGLVSQADAVLAVGTELAPADWWGGFPTFPDTVVRIDIEPAGVLANTVPSHPLVGDAAATLRLLDRAIEQHTAGQDRSAAAKWVRERKAELTAAQEQSAASWIDSLAALDRALPDDAVIAADNAMAAYNGALAVLRLKRPRSFLFPTGAGTLGYGLPAGIGARLADPGAPVVVIQGDGGIMFTLTELATAAEQKLSLPVIVYDNGGYGEIRNEMADRGDPEHAVALGSPDFVALAEALGCAGVLLDDDESLGDIVTRAFTADRPTLIHVLERSRAASALRAEAIDAVT